MTIAAKQLLIDDTVPATLVHAISGATGTVIVKNGDSANSVWIGGPDVTIEDGFALSPGETIPLSFDGFDELHATAAPGMPANIFVLTRRDSP